MSLSILEKTHQRRDDARQRELQAGVWEAESQMPERLSSLTLLEHYCPLNSSALRLLMCWLYEY